MVAEWALDDRDAERALQALAELPPGTARRTQALRLRLRAARLAQQPLEALRTARLLANHQAFTSTAARALLRSLAFDALDEARDAQQLLRTWEEFDPADRRDPCVAAHAAVRAAALDAPDEAHQWLRPFWERLSALERDERDQVALALMEAAGGLGNDWLPRLEVALNAFGHEPAIAAAVGSAYAGRQLWGKARPLLERAAAAETLAPRARRRAWWLLARLAQEEGDEARARHCEQAAIQIDD
jgi:HemY protein